MKSLSSSSSSARNPIAHLVAIRNRIILPPISNPCPSAVTRQEKAILLFNISRQNKFKSVTCVIVCSSLSLLVNIEIRYTEASNPLEIPINEYSTIQYTSCHILRDTLHFQPYVRVCDTNDTDGSFPVLHLFRPPPPNLSIHRRRASPSRLPLHLRDKWIWCEYAEDTYAKERELWNFDNIE